MQAARTRGDDKIKSRLPYSSPDDFSISHFALRLGEISSKSQLYLETSNGSQTVVPELSEQDDALRTPLWIQSSKLHVIDYCGPFAMPPSPRQETTCLDPFHSRDPTNIAGFAPVEEVFLKLCVNIIARRSWMMDLIENACKPQGQEEMARVMGDDIRATIKISQG